jgi:hypothetical protein
MKFLFTLVSLFSFIVQAQTPVNLSKVKVFKLEQENTAFQLQHVEKEDVFETKQVPDVCYRPVQRGTKKECHTEYDQKCETKMENVCNDIPYPVCGMVTKPVCESVPRNSCRTVPKQSCETVYEDSCHNETRPVCQTVPRRQCKLENKQSCTTTNTQVCENQSVPVCHNESSQVCETVQKCETVNDQVCRGQGDQKVCQTIPRRQCSPVQSCKTVNKKVCHNESKNVCRTVPKQSCSTVQEQVCRTVDDQVCHTQTVPVCSKVPRQSCRTVQEQVCRTEYDQVCHNESREECHDEYRRECHKEPKESCRDIPRQVCEQVPNIEQESYSCTKPIQVKVGEKVNLSVLANVRVEIANFGKVQLSQDELVVTLTPNSKSDEIELKLAKNDQKTLYRVLKKEKVFHNISETERVLDVHFVLEVFSLEQLNSIKDLKIIEPKIYEDRISFKLQSDSIQFSNGILSIVKQKRRRQILVMNDSFDPALKISKQGDLYEIKLSNFGIPQLDRGLHRVKLELKPMSLFKSEELLNPEILTQLNLGTIFSEFEDFPIRNP